MKNVAMSALLLIALAACNQTSTVAEIDSEAPDETISAAAIAGIPTATDTKIIDATIVVKKGEVKDFKNLRINGKNGSQKEGQPPLILLEDGATVKNVILGNLAQDGIHCKGTCNIINAWWEDVGEDAATFLVSVTDKNAVMTIDGGGASGASDKVFQHNAAGTMVIKNFYVENYGTFVRSCGNCSVQHKNRRVVIENVTAKNGSSKFIGINSNYNDAASIKKLTIVGKKLKICQRYNGKLKSEGGESKAVSDTANKTGAPFPPYCNYSLSDVTYK